MNTTVDSTPPTDMKRVLWLLSSPDNQDSILGNIGPNWYASVMGTGIIATAGATLPIHILGMKTFTLGVWVFASVLLVLLIIATALHWIRHPQVARAHGRDANMAQFYGAPPMALLTVGAGSVLVGKYLLGSRIAVDLDWVLWSLGTVLGITTAIWIPFRLFTQIKVSPDAAFGGWLMPIVPPMVSAATGALLIQHVASQNGRELLLYSLFAMFGMSLVPSFIVITLIWSRLAYYGTTGSARVPTLWIVLGPLGQSITAVGLLGANAHIALSAPLANAFSIFRILFGIPVWGFAILWIALATSLTVRTARKKLPFALTWWSFTFPVGTFVTGTTQLAIATNLGALRIGAVIAYSGLLFAWLLVAIRTAINSATGELFKKPLPTAPTPKPLKEELGPLTYT